MAYAQSPFRDFENYLRIVVALDKDDFQLPLKQYKSNFVSYELSLAFTQLNMFQSLLTPWVIMKGTLQIKYYDISLKTKLNSTHFDGISRALRFNENSFFITILGFTPYWIINLRIQLMLIPQVYTLVKKTMKLSTIDKFQFKCYATDST